MSIALQHSLNEESDAEMFPPSDGGLVKVKYLLSSLIILPFKFICRTYGPLCTYICMYLPPVWPCRSALPGSRGRSDVLCGTPAALDPY